MPAHPDRVWPLQGTSNFRDLGGYSGRDGRSVRWRRLFRSAHLGHLTDADRAALAALGLTRSFDFRGESESAAAPSLLHAGATPHALAIEPTVVQHMQGLMAAGSTLTGPVAAGLMQDLYRDLVNDHAHRFAELFQHLLQADAPLLFHCTAGKDRTGVAAALILLALGVPRDVVMRDYLLTNQHYQRPAHGLSDLPADVLAVLWAVRADYLQAALQTIDQHDGGLPGYLRQRLGLGTAELDALAARYLQER